jgi:hypothetical protein
MDLVRGFDITQRLLKTHNQYRIRTIAGIDLKPKKSDKLGYLQAFRNKAFIKIHNQHSPIVHFNSKIMTRPITLHSTTNINNDPGLR